MTYQWAPPERRWTDLLNSDCYDHRGSGRREDRLEVDDWLVTFLGLCGYESDRLPGAAGRAQLRRFRVAMARVVDAIVANGEPRAADLEAFNRYLRFAASRPRLERAGRRFELGEAASGKGLERVIGFLARNLADTLVSGEPERIKLCANPDCHWVIYDESRNRTRRWCDVAACGNLVKVRQFRERQAEGRRAAEREVSAREDRSARTRK